MPAGFCNPPMCWNLAYNFANINLIVIKPADVPNWGKGLIVPANQFAQMVAAFQAQLNAQALTLCGANCVCVRLHKKAVQWKLTPMRMGPHPAGGPAEIYMDGIVGRGWFGLCALRGQVRIQKGNKWVPVEDLTPPDIMDSSSTPPSPPVGGSKKKKGTKKKKQRLVKRRRR